MKQNFSGGFQDTNHSKFPNGSMIRNKILVVVFQAVGVIL